MMVFNSVNMGKMILFTVHKQWWTLTSRSRGRTSTRTRLQWLEELQASGEDHGGVISHSLPAGRPGQVWDYVVLHASAIYHQTNEDFRLAPLGLTYMKKKGGNGQKGGGGREKQVSGVDCPGLGGALCDGCLVR